MLDEKADESFVGRRKTLVNLNSISLDIRPNSFYLSFEMKRVGTVFNKAFAGMYGPTMVSSSRATEKPAMVKPFDPLVFGEPFS